MLVNYGSQPTVFSTTDWTFSIAFCVGVIKYLIFGYRRDVDDSVRMYNAVSHGLLNSIRIVLLSAFVPAPLRILIPTADIISILIRIVMRWRTRTLHKVPDYDLEKNIRREYESPREMEHVHVE